ncbi:MAG: sugar ABC transporter permease [Spirochaetes bacterium]|nr:sugar ABC transporter permease [Spirochaetota bacterium]
MDSLTHSRSIWKKAAPYLLIAPTIVWYGFFWARPVIQAFYGGFFDLNGHFTLDNYKFVFNDPYFLQAIFNTFFIAIVSVAVEFVLAFGLSLLINIRFKGAGVFLFIATIPMALPFVAIAAMWKAGLATYGWLNSFLYHVGLIAKNGKIVFMSGNKWPSIFVIIIIDAWGVIPSMMIILVAGMQNLNEELKEAGYIFGGTRLTVLRKITIPLLKSTITTALILRIISAIQIWAIITLMFGYLRLPTLVSQLVFYSDQRAPADPVYYQRALAYSVIVAIIISSIVILYLKVSGSFRKEENG